MSKVRNVHFSPDEYLAGTMGMTHQERGVYWQVCVLIYSSGGPILENDVRLYASPDNTRTTRATIEKLIKKSKIVRLGKRTGAELMVNRCRSELERAANRMRKASQNGAKGGRPRSTTQQNQSVKKPTALSFEKLPIPPPIPIPISTPTTRVSTPLRGGAPKKGTRLATDWKPNEENLSYAASKHNLTQQECDIIAEQFREYWTSPDCPRPTKKDWNGAWRRWVIKEGPELVKRRNAGRKPKGNGQSASGVLGAVAKAAARYEANTGFRGNGSGGVEKTTPTKIQESHTGAIEGTEFGYAAGKSK